NEVFIVFFFSSRRRHTRSKRDWSSDVCSSDLYQIYEAAKQLAKFSPEDIWIQNYVGGTDKQRQIEKLKSHQPQLVIGTPGRILDVVRENALDIHNAHYLVVDEADMTRSEEHTSELRSRFDL